eukprot:3940723-Rhodomonas_salina.1
MSAPPFSNVRRTDQRCVIGFLDVSTSVLSSSECQTEVPQPFQTISGLGTWSRRHPGGSAASRRA